jgi:hypothetical protein
LSRDNGLWELTLHGRKCMGHRATLIAFVVFTAVACGSSHNSNTEPDASLLGSGGSGVTTGSGGSSGSGSGGTSSNGTGTGSGSGGSAAAGSGGSGSNPGGMMMTGTGGFGGFNRDGGMPMMLVCPATQPMDGDMCMGGGFGGFGRGMSCMFGDTSCRCRRGMWRCSVPMMPPLDNDAGM